MGRLPAEWRVCADAFADDFTDVFLIINGVDVVTRGLRVQSQPFSFEADTFRTRGGAVSDGYWALIGPLAPGTYDISFGGSYFEFSTSTSYHLTVV